MTQVVLFFVYSNKYICANRIAGARRYAERRGWDIQVIERNARTLDVSAVIRFWNPIGIIAECAGGVPELSRETIGEIPLVYLDEDPDGEKGRALYVNSDNARVGETAAKELLRLDLPQYAFVGWQQPRFWSEIRRTAFQTAIRIHGKDCHVFPTPDGGAKARRRALAAWLKALPKPCGLFAVHDPVAEAVLQEASVQGIRVPEDPGGRRRGRRSDHLRADVAVPDVDRAGLRAGRLPVCPASRRAAQEPGGRGRPVDVRRDVRDAARLDAAVSAERLAGRQGHRLHSPHGL